MELVEYQKMDDIENDHWWFVAKRKFLAAAVFKFVGELYAKRVLDVGCGTGAILRFFNEIGAEAEGVDSSPAALEYCLKKGLKVQIGEATRLPYNDGEFDLVIASDMLEHVEKDAAAVLEIRRVLRPGGTLIVTVPAHQALFSQHDRALHHFRRYSLSQFRNLFSQFTLLNISWMHSLIFIPAVLIRYLRRGESNGDSDVRPSSKLINGIFCIWYRLEVGIYRTFGKLPFGLSLIAVVKK